MLSLLQKCGLALAFCAALLARAADAERIVKSIHFAKGNTAAMFKDSLSGRQFIDYRLHGAAGQTLKASLQGSNSANYFNILPPDSDAAAMYIGQIGANRFTGLLPTDGVYTLRVYLVRSAARRGERSDFVLSVEVFGKPLLPLPASQDAVIPGTPYHARGTVPCAPAYSKARVCDVFVIRRDVDGTATVELRWDRRWKRRILFVKGIPEAADVPQTMTFTRDQRGYLIVFNGDERFEIPEALIFGG